MTISGDGGGSGGSHAPGPRRRVPGWLALAVVVGLVAGAGSAWAAAANPRTERFFQADAAVSDGSSAGSSTGPSAGLDGIAPLDQVDESAAKTRPSTAPSTPAADPTPGVPVLPPGLTAADVSAGVLSADVPEAAGGTFVVVPGSEPGPGTGVVRTVRVEVERGLAIDGAAFARIVMATLNDPRGWGGDGSMSFARTDGAAQIRVLLASPKTVDALCAPLQTAGEVSCGRAGHAALNVRRWVEATPEFAADKTMYRQYLVNHEVGHLLGHQHQKCGGPGQLAPVMQQQTYQVAPCLPNAWPFPR